MEVCFKSGYSFEKIEVEVQFLDFFKFKNLYKNSYLVKLKKYG